MNEGGGLGLRCCVVAMAGFLSDASGLPILPVYSGVWAVHGESLLLSPKGKGKEKTGRFRRW